MNVNWEEVSDLFSAAIKLPADQQASFLDQRCGSNAPLRAEVERMLAEDEAADREGFLETQQWQLKIGGSDLPDLVGQEVGAYTIEAPIARGGMGDVYRARRTDGIEQSVAVKLIRDRSSADELAHRFRKEVNFQARVSQHANIAGLIDAGATEDGVLYLVMEYVDGKPIDQFCEAIEFDVRNRVELFQRVCSAVNFAHQQLVIHRDIKPSNILVTEDGTPFLLDFGIAGEESQEPATRTEYRALTPEYASPEQIRGDTLSTATDIFSLGVVLFELLTGSRPHDLSGLSRSERERLICEVDAPRPSHKVKTRHPDDGESERTSTTSKLRRTLAGDLDAIVMKALERNSSDRYQSVAELMDDITRYLNGEPVKATRQTVFYVARKFVRRHRFALVSTALVATALVAGMIGTTLGMIAASNQRDVAEAERLRANDLRGQLQDVLNEMVAAIRDVQRESKDVPEARELAERLAKKATEGLRQLQAAYSDDARPNIGLVDVNLALGDFAQITNTDGEQTQRTKREYYEEAYRLAKLLPVEGDSRVVALRAISRSALKLGNRKEDDDELDAAAELYQEARDILQGLVAEKAADQGDENGLASSSSYLADIHVARKEFDEAAANYGIAHEQYLNIERRNPDDERARRAVVTSFYLQARCAEKSGDAPKAIGLYRRACDQARTMIDELADTVSPSTRRLLAVTLNKVGALALKDDPVAARDAYEEGLGIVKQLLERDPENLGLQDDIAVSHMKIGDLLASESDYTAARRQYEKALEIRTRLLDLDEIDSSHRLNYYRSIYAIARVSKRIDDFDTAVTLCQAAVQRLSPAAEAESASVGLIASVAQLELECSDSLRQRGDYLQAADVMDSALERLRQSDETHGRDAYVSTIEEESAWSKYNRARAAGQSHADAIKTLDAKRQGPLLTKIGMERAKGGDYETAIVLADALVANAPSDLNSLYNAACIYAVSARSDTPQLAIEKAMALFTQQLGIETLAGPAFHDALRSDTDLDALRELPQFKALLDRVERQASGKP